MYVQSELTHGIPESFRSYINFIMIIMSISPSHVYIFRKIRINIIIFFAYLIFYMSNMILIQMLERDIQNYGI